jgi:hypothetical protein
MIPFMHLPRYLLSSLKQRIYTCIHPIELPPRLQSNITYTQSDNKHTYTTFLLVYADGKEYRTLPSNSSIGCNGRTETMIKYCWVSSRWKVAKILLLAYSCLSVYPRLTTYKPLAVFNKIEQQ